MMQLFDCREAFARALESVASVDPRIVVVVNDSVGSSNVGGFRARFPDRLINVGIAEQNLVGVSAGLAHAGLVPFACGAACFLTGRALEQLKIDGAYSAANVKLVGMSPGVAYGALGPTHHAVEDVAWVRTLPGVTVIVPADPLETEQAVEVAARQNGPVYLRVSRAGVPMIHSRSYRFELGRAAVVREGNDVTIIANGTMVAPALEAADLLDKHGIRARVLNMATVQPLDREAIVQAARQTAGIVTAEEHSVRGGLGSAVAEVVVQEAPVPMRILGLPPVFAPTGDARWILERFGLNARGICDAALQLLGKSGP